MKNKMSIFSDQQDKNKILYETKTKIASWASVESNHLRVQ